LADDEYQPVSRYRLVEQQPDPERPNPMPDPTVTAGPREANVVDIAEKFTHFTSHWSPKIIAQTNGWEIKLVKAHGEFAWHHHEVDEVFVVFAGELTIKLRGDSEVVLRPGQLYVVHRGVEHRPYAAAECQLILIEPPGVINTGEAGGELTAVDTWI